jgi:hypothetical protein
MQADQDQSARGSARHRLELVALGGEGLEDVEDVTGDNGDATELGDALQPLLLAGLKLAALAGMLAFDLDVSAARQDAVQVCCALGGRGEGRAALDGDEAGAALVEQADGGERELDVSLDVGLDDEVASRERSACSPDAVETFGCWPSVIPAPRCSLGRQHNSPHHQPSPGSQNGLPRLPSISRQG